MSPEELAPVFISYSSEDCEQADYVRSLLEAHGIPVWLDSRRLQGGEDWLTAIAGASDAAGVAVVVSTPHWKRSPWTLFEAYAAESVLPLTFAGDPAGNLPPALQRIHAFDLRDPAAGEWDRIAERIEELRIRAAQARPRARVIHNAPIRTGCFVGRETDLFALDQLFWAEPSAGAGNGRVVAVVGPAGVGKTTLVREYLDLVWRRFERVLFVRADTDRLVEEVAALAQPLEIEASRDEEKTARAVLERLERDSARPSLLVFDNLRRRRGKRSGSPLDELRPWVPTVGHCYTLVTARLRHSFPPKNTLALAPVSQAAGLELLEKGSGRSREWRLDQESDLREIVRDLGALPLALELAAHFMRRPSSGPAQFLERWHHAVSRRKLLGERPDTLDYPMSVQASVEVSLEVLDSQARDLISVASLLVPENVPLSLFRLGWEVLAGCFERAPEPSVPASFVADDAIRELADYALVEVDAQRLSIHRIVQAVERDFMEPGRLRRAHLARERALDAAVKATTSEAWGDRTLLASQAEPLLELEPLDAAAVARIYAFSSAHLVFAGVRLGLAERLREQAKRICREQGFRGAEAAALELSDALGAWYRAQYDSAAEHLRTARQIISGRAARPGELDVHLLNGEGLLASDRGDCEEAVRHFERAIELGREVLHGDHPLVGILHNNLAWCLEDMGRYRESAEHCEIRLEMEKRRAPPNWTNLANTCTNLATPLRQMGRLEEAARCIERALSLLGPEESAPPKYMALALTEAAAVHAAQGSYREARSLAERAMRIQGEHFGERHLDMAITAECLARIAMAEGRHRAAGAWLETAEDHRRLQLRAHPKRERLRRLRAELQELVES